MTNFGNGSHRAVLERIARRVMVEKGLAPDFPQQALTELARIPGPAATDDHHSRDLRHLPWCSIDNDDSRDLDQLTVAEALPSDCVKVLVAIADVSAVVKRASALDAHARQNTTSVYTAAKIFPMLPERLSTDLTSLNHAADRLAIVIEMQFDGNGELQTSDIYRAGVRNAAKLTYDRVADWLDGRGPMPAGVAAVSGLEANLRLQDHIAQQLKRRRHERGALEFETAIARPVFSGEHIAELAPDHSNRAKELIADFMIASNGVVARFLAARGLPVLRRVVRTPKRWERIVELASERGTPLPSAPDSVALERFLAAAKSADPLRFPDLSLSVIKLLGAGEYVAQLPGASATGHFALAVRDYAHSTAPNRRFPDLVTQRLVTATLGGNPVPYTGEELVALAAHCTEAEDAAKKVERQVQKSAAAILLAPRLGQRFEAIVTGAADKGTWVRLLAPSVEGRLCEGFAGIDVGQRLRVQLVHTDVERGYIDFKAIL